MLCTKLLITLIIPNTNITTAMQFIIKIIYTKYHLLTDRLFKRVITLLSEPIHSIHKVLQLVVKGQQIGGDSLV